MRAGAGGVLLCSVLGLLYGALLPDVSASALASILGGTLIGTAVLAALVAGTSQTSMRIAAWTSFLVGGVALWFCVYLGSSLTD